MYGGEIKEVLKSDPFTKKKFQGVFSTKNLPSRVENNSLYVLHIKNKEDEDIGHWTSIWTYGNPSTCFYYDSFGQPPPISICSNLLATCNLIEYSDIILQNILTITCGQSVCLQAMLLARGFTPYQIISHFQDIKRRGYLRFDSYVSLIINSLHTLKDAPLLHPDLFPPKKKYKNGTKKENVFH